ncbi:MAG: BASS family bile acid:Na+ symporter [Flavobacteriaceae bacterium]
MNLLDNAQINFDTNSLWILNLALGFVMFGIALSLDWREFKPVVLKPKSLLVGVFSQFFVLPFLTYLLVLIIKPDPSLALGMMLVAACPGGNISNFITHYANGNDALSVTLTAIATLLAVVMTPFNLAFWGGLYPPTASILRTVAIRPIEIVELVGLILALPLVLGMLVRKGYPNWAKKVSAILKKASLIFFFLLIALALQKNLETFKFYVMEVFWLVFIHNFIAFLSGFSFAKMAKLPWRDVKSITIETGIQNSGLGLLLIFSFFDGLGGMAILAASWGIWHLISGLILGTVFKKINSESLITFP